MNKYLIISIFIIILSVMFGNVFNVKASVAYYAECSHSDWDSSSLYSKVKLANDVVNEITDITVKNNLLNRLYFVWGIYNVFCINKTFDDSGTALTNSNAVSSLYERYLSTEDLVTNKSLTDVGTDWVWQTKLDEIKNRFLTNINVNCPAGNPSNSSYNNGTYDMIFTIDGNGHLIPPSTPTPIYDNTTPYDECSYKCDTGFSYDLEHDQCVLTTKQVSCGGSMPSNAYSIDYDDDGKFTQYWYVPTGSTQGLYLPQENNWHTDGLPDCRYIQCSGSQHEEGNLCVSNTKTVDCSGSYPTNSVKGATSVTVNWNGSEWPPVPSWTQNTSSSLSACQYRCPNDRHVEGSSCVLNTKSVSCGGNNPTNAVKGATSVTVNWDGSRWSSAPNWTPIFSGSPSACQYMYCGYGYAPYRNSYCKQSIFYWPTVYIPEQRLLGCNNLFCVGSNPTADKYCTLQNWDKHLEFATTTGKPKNLAIFKLAGWSDLYTGNTTVQYLSSVTCR